MSIVTFGLLVLAALASADSWWPFGSGTSSAPVIVATTPAYVPVGSLPLTSAQTASCQCQGKFTKAMQVCSTANITYATACQLHFAMRMSKYVVSVVSPLVFVKIRSPSRYEVRNAIQQTMQYGTRLCRFSASSWRCVT